MSKLDHDNSHEQVAEQQDEILSQADILDKLTLDSQDHLYPQISEWYHFQAEEDWKDLDSYLMEESTQ